MSQRGSNRSFCSLMSWDRVVLLSVLPTVVAVTTQATTLAASFPPPPSGYTFLARHAIGDSHACAAAHCGNLDPPDQICNTGCPKSAGAKECLVKAAADCEAKEACVAFALRQVGGNDDPTLVDGYQCWSAGLGNAVPNNDWYLYARSKPCSQCPAGSRQIGSPPVAHGAVLETMQCADNGKEYNRPPGSAVIYCDGSIGWATSFVVSVLVLALGYVGAGVALGRRQGKTGALMKSHPHFDQWVGLHGLVGDGIAFSRSRLGGHHPTAMASDRQQLVEADQPTDTRQGGYGATKRSKSERREQRQEKKDKRSSNSKTKRTKGAPPARQDEDSGSGSQMDPIQTADDGSSVAVENRQLQEKALVEEHLHESQAKIRVVGING